MSRLWTIVALCLVVAPSAAAEPPKWVEHRVAGVVFSAPPTAEVTTQEHEQKVTVVAVTYGDEVLLLTLYRGKSAPSSKRALAAHGEEFERRVSKLGPMRVGRDSLRVLGRKRKYRTIEHGAEGARERTSLMAVRLTKTTLVAAWTAPVTLRRTVSSRLLKGLAFK
ncbi:MAG: hypothetical protein QF464_18930 [Myxococcota bacterium]|jgi:hypothetical protein|nr:hypothetical protein [Myxococcota bacterium]